MTNCNRRMFLAAALTAPVAAGTVVPGAAPALAQTAAPTAAPTAVPTASPAWPVSTVTLLAPFAPGGSVDSISRLITSGLAQRLGATVIVENKAGASGAIGAAAVARAKPDGATWLVAFDTHGVNPSLQPLSFDTEKDLEPVLLIGTAPNVITCHPSRPWQSFQEVIAAAKASPGKITYASIGVGSLGHLTVLLLAKEAGISITHVAYRGGGPAVNDAVGGHVDLMIGTTALLNQQIEGKLLRPLLQTGKTRKAGLDVPTAIEAGFKDFSALGWWAVFAPKATPAPLIERFRAELVATMRDEKIGRQLADTQQIDLVLGGPDVLRPFLSQQIKTWGDVVREHGIKAQN